MWCWLVGTPLIAALGVTLLIAAAIARRRDPQGGSNTAWPAFGLSWLSLALAWLGPVSFGMAGAGLVTPILAWLIVALDAYVLWRSIRTLRLRFAKTRA